jgi:CHASE2 domain-containing sensor protein
VKSKAIRRKQFIQSALGAVVVVLCGLTLWKMPFAEAWVNSSYDYLFRFGTHAVTNRVVLIQMDNEAYDQFHQRRGEPWDRALHAQLLNRLAEDGCALVVMDSFFRSPRDPSSDAALAEAMMRQRGIVLMAEQAQVTLPELAGARPVLPTEPFLTAARTNWGVAWLDPDLDSIVRRNWPFPAPGPYPSLSRTAARLAGAQLDEKPHERWLRYYGRNGPWTELSYGFALSQPKGYFRDQIVFIGSHPRTSLPDGEADEFSNPYTRWTGESTGGVEILITSFLNLMNGDWLRRPADWVEVLALIITGIALGGGLWRLRPLRAFAITAGVMVGVGLVAIVVSYFTNYWFPWLVIVGGQAPCAFLLALGMKSRVHESTRTEVIAPEPLPEIPGYELFPKPFGEGAYGKVWLARKPQGKWQALKVIYLARFDQNTDPYEREFNGVSRYQPVSDQHPGLLPIHFLSAKQNGFFYYVMDLGDAVEPGWENDPSRYKPRDLVNVRANLHGHRLPVWDCLTVGLQLTDALEFLHQKGLTHRDIKPQNVIFVNGQPKLADVGLIAEIRPDEERTIVGTPGFMPPAPEIPGTPQADIYSLGMVLYVLSTGKPATRFPEISTTLVDDRSQLEFFSLNAVILKACQPTPAERYQSAGEMKDALKQAQQKLQTNRAAASQS